ncbi:MAG: 3-phosphoshikimate 1-carboxyvinyltransferase [Piscirickettsiaceae bacterium]|nr:MAG: 3-phosphoshikimate 1-carboxyvinyltransferase [Piscirickettsiaceae bacterium]
MNTFLTKVSSGLTGAFRVPGDKSISHRAIMLGSLAEGVTNVSGFLEAEDALATLKTFQSMGVKIERLGEGRVRIHGVGLKGLKKPMAELYMGNSGTSMRLLAGLLSGQGFNTVLTGDRSLSKRPMKRVLDPLKRMGAEIDSNENGTAPLKINGNTSLTAIEYDMPIGSAQVKSCILLAGLYADGITKVTEPVVTRDHTEQMLKGFGYSVERNGSTISLKGGGQLTATNIDVPGDISSAAFLIVAALITPDSEITIEHVGINPTRTGVISILKAMGANIVLLNERLIGGEKVADIRVQSSQLTGIVIPEKFVALAIDEFPVIFIAAACAQGTTVLTGAEELRVKESDRIQSMAEGMAALGIDAVATNDGMIVQGGDIKGGVVESHDDHRIAMSFAVAGLRSQEGVQVNNCENVNTSFPGFVELVSNCGFNMVAK